MARSILRLLALTLALLPALACSQERAEAAPALVAAQASRVPLFREAAASDKADGASVPVQASLAPLIERLRPSVVNISTTTELKHPPIRSQPQPRQRGKQRGGEGGGAQDDFDEFFERFFGGKPGPQPDAPDTFKGNSLGSGLLLNTEGFVLTNNHVVKDATDIRVRLSDGREFSARLVGRDALTDLALLQLNGAPRDLPAPLPLGDSDALRQGDFVLAMGSPFGLRDTATLGIVSAKHRAGINPGATYDDFIQTDAAINPGNSGGPLFNLRGEVVGINTAIVSPQIGQGIGFAVPINLAKALLPQLREKGKVTRGFLGVSVADLTPDLSDALRLKAGTQGALVQNVVPRSPAEKAGVKPGDVITQLNGKPLDSAGALTRSVALVAPGQAAKLTLVRENGQTQQVEVRVAARPEDEVAAVEAGPGQQDEDAAGQQPTPKLGVSLAKLTPELAQELGLTGAEGVVVLNVVEDGPADRAGLGRGDLITEVNRKAVKTPEDVKALIGKMKDGEMALLRVRRGVDAVFVPVPVGGKK
ncbi:MAG: PDZ domain-containing protein [Anaeromyxobacter sp.]